MELNLCEDWLKARKACLEFEPAKLILGEVEVPLGAIKTDHKPLKYLLEAEWTNKKIQQWALNLSGYNCKIEYLAGKDNTCADLLSRIPEQLEVESIHLEPGVDDRTYQVNVLNAHTLGNRPSLEENQTEDFVTLSDPHWRGVIESSQKDEEVLVLRKKVWVWVWVLFNGISTPVGHLMPKRLFLISVIKIAVL